MKEIVSLQIGNFGNTLGNLFWEDLFFEKTQKSEIFIQEDLNQFTPRCLSIDSNPDFYLESYKSLINPENHVIGTKHNEKNYAIGLTDNDLATKSLELTRKLIEKCESFAGFQFFHSIGGGTGTGVFKNIIESLKDDHLNKAFVTFSCFPSESISEQPLEKLNALLGLHVLIENSTLTLCLDNEKTLESVNRVQDFQEIGDLNFIMRQHVSDFTSLLRFPSGLPSYYKVSTFMNIYPRMHFCNISASYEHCVFDHDLFIKTIGNIFYKGSDIAGSGIISAVSLLRGFGSSQKSLLFSWAENNKSYFINWFEPNLFYQHISSSTKYSSFSLSHIQNSCNIQYLFKRILNKARPVHCSSTLLQNYLMHGMDKADILEADCNVDDIVLEYGSFSEEYDEQPEEQSIDSEEIIV